MGAWESVVKEADVRSHVANSVGEIRDKLNLLVYVFRRNRWMFDTSRWYRTYAKVRIDRPIFLLGTQGGGLTLVARMLKRHRQVVTVTGDHRYWTGADEIQNVLGQILPRQLTGIKHKAPADDMFPPPRGWLYAVDRLIDLYRNTAEDATVELRDEFQRILRWAIHRQSGSAASVRFLDKSQLYTVKVAFLDALLKGCQPRFLLVTRDPYAICYRSASGKARSLSLLSGRFSFEERLRLAAQHWTNSMRRALEDGGHVEWFKTVRFEDVLSSPEQQLREICQFVELTFDPDMLPQPDHRVPFGSRFEGRWYPLRPDVNTPYLEEMTSEHVQIIAEYCQGTAKTLGYDMPRRKGL